MPFFKSWASAVTPLKPATVENLSLKQNILSGYVHVAFANHTLGAVCSNEVITMPSSCEKQTKKKLHGMRGIGQCTDPMESPEHLLFPIEYEWSSFVETGSQKVHMQHPPPAQVLNTSWYRVKLSWSRCLPTSMPREQSGQSRNMKFCP